MNEIEARELAESLRGIEAAGGPVKELHGLAARDFNWVRREDLFPIMLGSFRVEPSGTVPFYVSVVAKSAADGKVFINDKVKGSAILEPNTRTTAGLIWRYKAAKQSGDNNKRNEAFRQAAGSLELTIPFPRDDVQPFAEAIARAIQLRRLADAAGGSTQQESDSDDDVDDDADPPLDALRAWYPDARQLHAVAMALTDAIRVAHDANPKGWCVTRPRDKSLIRMNAGIARAFDVKPGAVELAATLDDLTVQERASVSPMLDRSDGQVLSGQTYGDNGALILSPDTLTELPIAYRKAHKSFIVRGVRSRTPFGRFHNRAVLEALRELTGEEVPDPELPISYWKISPGESGQEWDQCREGKYIAIGWNELGDLSTTVNEAAFDTLAAVARERYGWGQGVDQVWKFRNIQPGDRVVANSGTRKVLGIGTVMGPYFYAPGATLAHRLPVHWDDVAPREVEKLGWRKTLIRLTEAAFEELQKAPTVDTSTMDAPKPEVSPPSGGIDFDGIVSHLESQSLWFPGELIASYLLALQTKRFVLLTGISGTGKTQLAVEVAKVFATEQHNVRNYELVAVRPDWTDCRALQGFHNPLTGSYASTPTLDLVLRARAEEEAAAAHSRSPHPFFLIFDEMNLARVEHYFSDFLSAMESGEEIHLHDDHQLLQGSIPRRVALPSNLFVVGTVNVDETTYMFSPKVLDRSFVLEFNQVDLDVLGGGPSNEDGTSGLLSLTRMGEGLRLLGKATNEEWTHFAALADGKLRLVLGEMHMALAKQNRHFGYRVAREIARFVNLAEQQTSGSPDTVLAAFDVAILAKILPKLHGTQAELDSTLLALLQIALGEGGDSQTWMPTANPIAGPAGAAPKLPRSALKLWRMRDRLRTQGFTSFIE